MAKVWKWQKTHFQDASTRTWQQRWNKSQWQSPGWILTLNLKQFLDLQNGQWWKRWWRSWVGGTVARTEGISSDTWLSSRGFPLLAVSTGQCPPPLQLGEASFATCVCNDTWLSIASPLDNVHCKLPPPHLRSVWTTWLHYETTVWWNIHIRKFNPWHVQFLPVCSMCTVCAIFHTGLCAICALSDVSLLILCKT